MRRIAACVLFLAACGGYREAPVRVADRARAPTTGQWGAPAALPDPRTGTTTSSFVHTKARTITLRNGIRVVFLQRHDLPIVAMTVAVARGKRDEQPGAVEILLELLENGPKTRKPSMADYIGWLGARSSAFSEQEFSGITFEMLSNHTTSVALTSGEMFAQSSYDSEEHDEAKRNLVASLRSWRVHIDNAGAQAALATLGLTHRPDPDVVDKVSVADVERTYRNLIAPDSLVVAVVGDFLEGEMQTVLEKAFAPLTGKAKPTSRAAPVATSEKFLLLDRSKGEQSAIVITTPAPRLQDEDAAAFQLACSVLGSRLEDSTRIAKGYTYGVSTTCADFVPYMKVVLDVTAARTKEALTDVLQVMKSLHDTPASKEEVSTARSWLARTLTSRFTTNVETSKELARAVAAGLPPDALAALFDQTAGVTPEQLTGIAEKWLADPHVVVLGDATAITGDISTVGLGAPVVRSMP